MAESRAAAPTTPRLGTFKPILVASPAYLAQHGTPQSPSDLMQHACLHYRFPNSGRLETWVLGMPPGEPELQLPTTMISNNIEARLCLAMRGQGIAYLPDFSVRAALQRGDLVEVLPGHVEWTGAFHVLWPASKHPSPKVRALVDFLSARVFPPDLPPSRTSPKPRMQTKKQAQSKPRRSTR